MIRTIVVDDEVLARLGIRTFLETEEEIQVDELFASAEDALLYLQENEVDVILTDIEMADMNGLQFIQKTRELGYSGGILIISCHEDFNYARQAMAYGADNYILKQELDEAVIIGEVKKIYEEKKSKRGKVKIVHETDEFMPVNQQERYQYLVGVIRILPLYGSEDSNINEMVDQTMVHHLIEEIVSKDSMGTLFAPHKKEPFVLFHFQEGTAEVERANLLKQYSYDLNQNINNYIGRRLVIGLSQVFTDLTQVSQRHQEAVGRLTGSFYSESQYLFLEEEEAGTKMTELVFETDHFLEEEGMQRFEQVWEEYLWQCRSTRQPPEQVKNLAYSEFQVLVRTMVRRYHLGGAQKEWWESGQFREGIEKITDVTMLEQKLLHCAAALREEVREQLQRDPMKPVIAYIEEHLNEEITLAEMAEQSCMSANYFCKIFKERTGRTLVNYINEKRIEQVKQHLHNKTYSLEKIAEITGFHNVNYMTRVFKKVTGLTIHDYKNVRL